MRCLLSTEKKSNTNAVGIKEEQCKTGIEARLAGTMAKNLPTPVSCIKAEIQGLLESASKVHVR